jgi:hypothetical protein
MHEIATLEKFEENQKNFGAHGGHGWYDRTNWWLIYKIRYGIVLQGEIRYIGRNIKKFMYI